jgi:hypothetical protein
MSYYTALITAWNGATQPPAGVTGAGLTGGMSTAQKLAAVNAWTVVGSVPTSILVTGAQVANCINWTEFAALTATQQANLLALCNQPGQLLSGSAQLTHLLPGMLLAYFSVSGPTIVALTALAAATPQPWWQYAGYFGSFNASDAQLAGLV